MKIVCATSVLEGVAAFSSLGDMVSVPESDITPDVVRGADALITRSKTRITRDLLEGSSVRFYGSATAGTDHIDSDYLNERGIAWCAAAGCNANSVAEYVVAAMLCVAQRHGLLLSDLTLGVIGVGHIGSRVADKARVLGMPVLLNDPPREAATGEAGFIPLNDLLEQSDIVTLHVPWTRGIPHATDRLAGASLFERMRPGSLFINTSRGEVVESDALLLALDRGVVFQTALDVWENEPAIRAELLDRAAIGTPHIAGYSHEGRLNGTAIVYRELCNFLEVEPEWLPAIPPVADVIEADARGRLEDEVLWNVVRNAYDIEADDARLREALSLDAEARARHFRACRMAYPERREFAAHRVVLKHAEPGVTEKIKGLGFAVAE